MPAVPKPPDPDGISNVGEDAGRRDGSERNRSLPFLSSEALDWDQLLGQLSGHAMEVLHTLPHFRQRV